MSFNTHTHSVFVKLVANIAPVIDVKSRKATFPNMLKRHYNSIRANTAKQLASAAAVVFVCVEEKVYP